MGRSSKGIVVVALLVLMGLGGVLVPEFMNESRRQRDSALATDLRFLNEAAKLYREQHHDAVPGVDEDSVAEERLVRQLTLPTDAQGALQPGGTLGPYLKVGIPPNPWNGSSEIKMVTSSEVPPVDGTSGWLFHVPTARFHSNARATAE